MSSKVIIASHNATFVSGLRSRLNAQGFEVAAVCLDSYDLLRRSRALHPDVIILDEALPGIDSVTLVEALIFEKQNIVVIGKSYQKSFYQQQTCLEFIEKPVQMSVLVTVLRMITKYGQTVKKLETRVDKLEKKQQQDKVVSKAKRLLQSEEGYTEVEAHEYLQKRSMELRISKSELAKRLLNHYETKS